MSTTATNATQHADNTPTTPMSELIGVRQTLSMLADALDNREEADAGFLGGLREVVLMTAARLSGVQNDLDVIESVLKEAKT